MPHHRERWKNTRIKLSNHLQLIKYEEGKCKCHLDLSHLFQKGNKDSNNDLVTSIINKVHGFL
jgi:hypothetical protein